MSFKSLWSVSVLSLLIIGSINCELTKVNETITISKVATGDTHVILTIDAPLTIDGEYIERFEITYQLINGDAQFEPKTDSQPIKERKYRYQVELKNLEANGHYRLNVTAVYGSSGQSEFYASSAEGEIEVTTSPLAPRNFAVKELILRLKGTKVSNYFVQVDRVTSINDLHPVMHATIYPEMGDVLPLQLIAGERYIVKIWYIDLDGNKSAVNSRTYSM